MEGGGGGGGHGPDAVGVRLGLPRRLPRTGGWRGRTPPLLYPREVPSRISRQSTDEQEESARGFTVCLTWHESLPEETRCEEGKGLNLCGRRRRSMKRRESRPRARSSWLGNVARPVCSDPLSPSCRGERDAPWLSAGAACFKH